jgi:DNA/RNA-binding domain of Phe-tRNA-synthetase-like protein
VEHERSQSVAEAIILADVLAAAAVNEAALALRPDYRALLIAVDGIHPGESDDTSEALLDKAEQAARTALAACELTDLPHVASWRDAYRAFGAKPQRTRNSLEALLRRADGGLPRVNRLTDVYNAVSVIHQIPLGGEDLARYQGAPRLLRATGREPFDTVSDGHDVLEHPEPGEVIWCDDAGVTCRRWNWRQARRTQLSADTTTALFILDALDPLSDDALDAAGDDLVAHLTGFSPALEVARRTIASDVSAAGADRC